MGYRFLDDVSIADIVFEVDGKNLNELFGYASDALVNTLIKNVKDIRLKTKKSFEVKAKSLDLLLVDYLNKLIFYKDAERLVFKEAIVTVEKSSGVWKALCDIRGEKLDPKRHEMSVDVKAATMHMLKLEENKSGWDARLVLDI